MIGSSLLLCQLLNLTKKFGWKISELPNGCIRKQKVEKIQLFEQKEAFFSVSEFAFPHCSSVR